MDKSSLSPSACCAMAKKELMAALRQCDLCATSYDEFHECYREAARISGQNARSCIID